MIHMNSTHEIRIDASSDATRSAKPTPGTSCTPNHSNTWRITFLLPNAVSAMVMTIATNKPTMATRSDSLVRMNPGESWRIRPHIWVSASRRFAIQPSPAQAAVAKPMMPTEVRESIADSISLTSCWETSPDTVDLTLSSISLSSSGWLARTKPPIANPTINNGNSANTVKYVMPAA